MEQPNKTVGVAVDNYKVQQFKKVITEEGFTILKTEALSKGTQLIQVDCLVKKLFEFASIIQNLEMFFKRKN